MNRLQNEDGFTLVELLIASIIASILIGSVGAALLVGLKTTDSIATRFNNSHDAQLLAAWLDPDIISAGPPNGAIDSTNVGTGCSTTPAGTNVVRFKWTGSEDGTTRYASYRRNGALLTRYFCVAAGPILKSVVVSHNLDTANPPVWDSALKKLSVTVIADNTAYAFAVSANPRYGIVAPSGGGGGPATTSISQVAAGGAPGAPRTTTATISGGTSSATGTLAFQLFGPGAGCSGTQVGATEGQTVAGANGTAYTSSARTPPSAGNYWWLVSYSGDASNQASSNCTQITITTTPKVHIGNITGTGSRSGGSSNFAADITVTVYDQANAPIASVTVSGSWSDSASPNCSATTNAAGTCTLASNGTNHSTTPVTWTVSSLSLAGYTYDSASNVFNKITCTRSSANSGATSCVGST